VNIAVYTVKAVVSMLKVNGVDEFYVKVQNMKGMKDPGAPCIRNQQKANEYPECTEFFAFL